MTNERIALLLHLLTNQSTLIKLQENTLVDYKFYYVMSILLTAAVKIQIICKNKTPDILLHYKSVD